MELAERGERGFSSEQFTLPEGGNIDDDVVEWEAGDNVDVLFDDSIDETEQGKWYEARVEGKGVLLHGRAAPRIVINVNNIFDMQPASLVAGVRISHYGGRVRRFYDVEYEDEGAEEGVDSSCLRWPKYVVGDVVEGLWDKQVSVHESLRTSHICICIFFYAINVPSHTTYYVSPQSRWWKAVVERVKER